MCDDGSRVCGTFGSLSECLKCGYNIGLWLCIQLYYQAIQVPSFLFILALWINTSYPVYASLVPHVESLFEWHGRDLFWRKKKETGCQKSVHGPAATPWTQHAFYYDPDMPDMNCLSRSVLLSLASHTPGALLDLWFWGGHCMWAWMGDFPPARVLRGRGGGLSPTFLEISPFSW